MYKHVLIPTDGLKLSSKAEATGLTLARALDAKVTALTVTRRSSYRHRADDAGGDRARVREGADGPRGEDPRAGEGDHGRDRDAGGDHSDGGRPSLKIDHRHREAAGL